MSRFAYAVLGWLAVTLGLIGVVLPGLPTTVFMILAAYLFGRSSPRLRQWLLDHPAFGPAIRDWEDRGAISPRGKKAALLAMAAVLAISLVLGLAGWIIAMQAVCMAGAATFILSRPD